MLSETTAFARELVARGDAPSICLAVVGDGVVAGRVACGDADVEAGRAATPDTPYLLASVTKPIVATAVCLLAERGLVDLDAPLDRYLPAVRFGPAPTGSCPTPRQLLSHTSGLDLYLDFAYADRALPQIVLDPVAATAAYGHLVAEPGEQFLYTNLGYGLLAELFPALTGRSLSLFLAEEVFAPLGLHQAHLGPRHPHPDRAAVPYGRDGVRYPEYDTAHAAASLAWATVTEVAWFAATAIGAVPGVLSGPTLAQMLAPTSVCDTYGLGWERVPLEDGGVGFGHIGSMGGVSTAMLAVAGTGVAIAVAANAMGEAAEAVLAAATGELGIPALVRPPAPADRFCALAPGRWVGTLVTPDGPVTVELVVDADGPVLSIAGARVRAGTQPVFKPLPDADLVATFDLRVPAGRAADLSPYVLVSLRRRAGGLTGSLRAMPSPDGPGSRFGNCLSFACDLDQVDLDAGTGGPGGRG